MFLAFYTQFRYVCIFVCMSVPCLPLCLPGCLCVCLSFSLLSSFHSRHFIKTSYRNYDTEERMGREEAVGNYKTRLKWKSNEEFEKPSPKYCIWTQTWQ